MDISKIWIVIFVICVVCEVIRMNLYGTCIGIGAVVAGIVGLFHIPVLIQLVVFMVVSIGLLFIIRPLGLRHINKAKSQSSLADLIGKTAVVVSEIDNSQRIGKVKVNNTEWAAKSARKSLTYQTGTVVKIVDIYGGKLIVKK